jgi:hypothetical protein
LIVYPPDGNGNFQEKSAIVITPFTQNLVRGAIKSNLRILMGASRDNPPTGSPGVLQSHISKIIMLDVIIFGIIHKKVGPASLEMKMGG